MQTELSPVRIGRASPSEAPPATELNDVLARAFAADPFFPYTMPHRADHSRLTHWWVGTFLRYGLKYGEVFVNPGKPQGVCMWLGPDKPMVDTFQVVRLGMYQAPFRFGLRGTRRMQVVTDHWQALQEQQAKPFYYLMMIGVDPSAQGQGLGGALLQPMLERADREGLPCYLETCKATNIPFYRKHGFELLQDFTARDGAESLPYWNMLRPAKSKRVF